jgi:ATP/maltotriose-dependent transcriptional regulator MalT
LAATVGRRSSEPYTRRIVERTRLLELLEREAGRTIILLAPAGYGKTTLARQWIERVGGAWVSVSAASGDIPVLARDLAAAIAEFSGLDTQRVEIALQAARTPADQASMVARTILGQVAEPLTAWIVLDDYQHLTGNAAAEELVGRLERSGKFRFLITSRERPKWATSRRRVHLETVELGSAELALDEAEVAELLPPDRRTAELRRQARGWPAVIGLAAHARLADVDLTADALSEQLYDYLAEELFECAGEEVRGWLTALAVLPPLTPRELSDFLGEIAGPPQQVVATGLAYEAQGRIEVHPLAREFLLAKLQERGDAHRTAVRAFELALSSKSYTHAFAVADELQLDERLEDLIVESYTDLVETGRLATLAKFGRYAGSRGAASRTLLDLISAEVALTEGSLEHAQILAHQTAESLAADHKLKARSYLVAGRAAHLRMRFEDSFNLHELGRRSALSPGDLNASIFGMCFSAVYLEDERIEMARREVLAIKEPRPTDQLRLDMFRSQLWMYGIDEGGGDHTEALELAATISDPWVRSSWSYVVGTTLMLRGRYAESASMLRDTLKDLSEFGLAFAMPRVRWSLAAAELGLRHFANCDSHLRMVERHRDHARDVYAQLNARALRARLHLAQQSAAKGVEITLDEFDDVPSRAMHGEYVATRALCLATVGEASRAVAAATQARALTRSADAVVLASAALAVVACQNGRAEDPAFRELLQVASRKGVWDGVVCAVRASPELLERLAKFPDFRAELCEVLLRAKDVHLAKSAGLVTRTTAVPGVLSPREREVIDHVRQGKTNAEIAASLFISVGTVKRHIDNAYKKLGAKNRAEAIARYAEIEN